MWVPSQPPSHRGSSRLWCSQCWEALSSRMLCTPIFSCDIPPHALDEWGIQLCHRENVAMYVNSKLEAALLRYFLLSHASNKSLTSHLAIIITLTSQWTLSPKLCDGMAVTPAILFLPMVRILLIAISQQP